MLRYSMSSVLHTILGKIPTIETYCARIARKPDAKLLRFLHTEDVGLRTLFEAVTHDDPTFLQNAGNLSIEYHAKYLEEKEMENEKKSSWAWGLKVLGVAAVAAVGAVVAAPAVIAAAGFTSTGISAGSFGAWFMSTYGGAVAAGSLCAFLQSAGAAGLSAAASAGIGAASFSTTWGIGSLINKFKTYRFSEPKGMSKYCRVLVEKNLITEDEHRDILKVEKAKNRTAALQALFSLLLKKNIGIRKLFGKDTNSLEYAEKVVTNVFNQLLQDLNPREVATRFEILYAQDQTEASVDDGIARSKLCVLATMAGVLSTVITPALLSAFGIKSDGLIEDSAQMAALFITLLVGITNKSIVGK